MTKVNQFSSTRISVFFSKVLFSQKKDEFLSSLSVLSHFLPRNNWKWKCPFLLEKHATQTLTHSEKYDNLTRIAQEKSVTIFHSTFTKAELFSLNFYKVKTPSVWLTMILVQSIFLSRSFYQHDGKNIKPLLVFSPRFCNLLRTNAFRNKELIYLKGLLLFFPLNFISRIFT